MTEISLQDEDIIEVLPELAIKGATDDLAERLSLTKRELEQFIAQDAPKEVLQAVRRELGQLLADKLLAMSPLALEKLQEAVELGNIRAIENVLDRSGQARVSRRDINLGVTQVQQVNFSAYIEQAQGDYDMIEQALSDMKSEIIEGEFREEEDG